jgi:hypothetical protein
VKHRCTPVWRQVTLPYSRRLQHWGLHSWRVCFRSSLLNPTPWTSKTPSMTLCFIPLSFSNISINNYCLTKTDGLCGVNWPPCGCPPIISVCETSITLTWCQLLTSWDATPSRKLKRQKNLENKMTGNQQETRKLVLLRADTKVSRLSDCHLSWLQTEQWCRCDVKTLDIAFYGTVSKKCFEYFE